MHIINYHRVVFIIFLVAFFWAPAQTNLILKKGTVIDSLFVPGTANYFSIYLPTNFDMSKNWPIILGLESKRKAYNLTKLYQEAAEEYGYVVAVTTSLQENTPNQKLIYFNVFMDYILSTFPIQENRIYVTGIDEDAKLMSLTPVAYSDKVTGVIAIGNSYFYTNRTKLKKNFSHVGILNRNNFRLKDFQRNRSYLKRKSMEADVITYAGISQYPYPTLLKQPLSSFTLQAMLKGRIPKDSIWIKNQFENEIKQSEINIRKGQYLQGYNGIKRTRIKYHWFFDTSYLRDREKQIRKIKGYKQEKRSQVKYRNLESYYKQIYPFMIEEDIAGKQYENLGWWQYQISELDTMAAKNDTYAKEMVSRTKSYLKNRIQFKIDKLSKKKKDFEKRMFLNIFSTIIDRKDYTSYQNIISLSTQDLDYKTSLFYLEKLLENGFKDIDALYNIEGTLPLRITKEYNELIKKHLGRSRYFSSE